MVIAGGGAVAAEDAVRRGAPGVHHPLGDPLVVEVGDLLPQVVVLEQHRPARPGLQRVVGVVQPGALGGGQVCAALRHAAWSAPVGLAGGADVSGPRWSGLGGSGSCGSVGSATGGLGGRACRGCRPRGPHGRTPPRRPSRPRPSAGSCVTHALLLTRFKGGPSLTSVPAPAGSGWATRGTHGRPGVRFCPPPARGPRGYAGAAGDATSRPARFRSPARARRRRTAGTTASTPATPSTTAVRSHTSASTCVASRTQEAAPRTGSRPWSTEVLGRPRVAGAARGRPC